MTLYLDASALVKLYIEEAGSVLVAKAVASAKRLYTCRTTAAEVTAAIAKGMHRERLTAAVASASRAEFREDWPNITHLGIDEEVALRAADLAWQHRLRGYDAVHLACALDLRERLGEQVTVATYDKELHRAAQNAGLLALPESL